MQPLPNTYAGRDLGMDDFKTDDWKALHWIELCRAQGMAAVRVMVRTVCSVCVYSPGRVATRDFQLV